jgi:hypothetical protein
LGDFTKQLGYEKCKKDLIPILETLLVDEDPAIRAAFSEQIPSVGRAIIALGEQEPHYSRQCYELVINSLFAFLSQLTLDENEQVTKKKRK